jgi:dTDP-4-dehydrorhamnose 3,5-epimerase
VRGTPHLPPFNRNPRAAVNTWRPHSVISGDRDQQTVTPEGKRIEKMIDGVVIRAATTHFDERGEVCEIYDPAWGVTGDPLVYVYQALIRPGRIKGWVYHEKQKDRLFVSLGTLKIVLYDMREGSPTHGMINELHLSERNRGLLVIPPKVLHAVQNIGLNDGLFVNMPSKPYNHQHPDKFRIPIDSGTIPYIFNRGVGW